MPVASGPLRLLPCSRNGGALLSEFLDPAPIWTSCPRCPAQPGRHPSQSPHVRACAGAWQVGGGSPRQAAARAAGVRSGDPAGGLAAQVQEPPGLGAAGGSASLLLFCTRAAVVWEGRGAGCPSSVSPESARGRFLSVSLGFEFQTCRKVAMAGGGDSFSSAGRCPGLAGSPCLSVPVGGGGAFVRKTV